MRESAIHQCPHFDWRFTLKIHPHLFVPGAACAILLAACSGPADSPADLLAITAPSFASGGLGPPRTGSGTGVITSLEITSERQAGPNRIQERTLTGILDGALQGSFEEHARGVIHGTGLITFQATFVFTGTVEGCEGDGSFSASLSGTGQAGLPVTEASFRVVNQASNTLRISGTGTMRQEGPLATYEVRYVCR
jgi:hypothetical protein